MMLQACQAVMNNREGKKSRTKTCLTEKGQERLKPSAKIKAGIKTKPYQDLTATAAMNHNPAYKSSWLPWFLLGGLKALVKCHHPPNKQLKRNMSRVAVRL